MHGRIYSFRSKVMVCSSKINRVSVGGKIALYTSEGIATDGTTNVAIDVLLKPINTLLFSSNCTTS